MKIQFRIMLFQAEPKELKKEKISFETDNDLDTSAASELSMLPSRNRGNYLSKCRTTNLTTNMYKVELDESRKISVFSVKITPNIANDSTKKINKMLNLVRCQLKEYIGDDFIICGRTVFTCQDKLAIRQQVKTSVSLDNEKYNIILKKVKQVDMSLINSHHKKQNLLPLNFLNNLVKRFFSDMGYVQIGTCGKYVNPASRQVLNGSGLIMFNGYEAAISLQQNGFYLRVDSLSRVVQDKTVLEMINSIYKSNSQLSKQQKRVEVKQQLIGLTVVANYGNSRCWRISDVEFDIDLKNHRIGDQTSPTFTQYYYKNYGLTIKNPKQPLLKAKLNGLKTKGFALLVPQFLLLSGIPDSFDQRRRRQVSQKTILPPNQKLKRIDQLMADLNNQSRSFTPSKISKNLGISISQQQETVDAIAMNTPLLQLGKDSVEQNKVANFALFNKQLFRTSVPLKIAAIIPDDYDFTQIQKLFSSTCKNLNLKYDFCVMKINYKDQRHSKNLLQNLIQDKNQKLKDRNLNWFILPGNQKSLYTLIKKLSSETNQSRITQVSLTSTLGKKGFASIVTKTLIQIACKVGNVAWAPQIPKVFAKNTFMLMGIDTAKDSANKKMQVLSYCCSLDKQSTKFHSKYLYQPSSLGFNSKIKDAVADCLMSYAKTNGYFPSQLIVLSNGCSFSQKNNLISNEIADIKSFLANTLSKTQIRLTYLTIDKASKQKFFANGKGIVNPSYGTLVNSKVVGKNYDFYMIAQHCNRGTVKPIHYEVIYTDSSIQEGILQEFLYSQCFNYMNWTGSVRVPGVLQYATKLSKLATQHLNQPLNSEKLENSLFYI